ncbi:hypothetical protein Tco_0452386 [Tanacetum coccineum]
MVTPEDKKIERYIWGLTLDIQGNITSSKQAIQMAHNLMDQTMRANATRNAENKIKWCKLYHTGPCTMQCINYKRVGNQTRDCRTPTLATTQRAPMTTQKASVTCFRCCVQGNYKSECPKFNNQNRGNQNNGGARGKAFVLRGQEAIQDPTPATTLPHLVLPLFASITNLVPPLFSR